MGLKEKVKSQYLFIKYACLVKHIKAYHSNFEYKRNCNGMAVLKYNDKLFYGFYNSADDDKSYDLLKQGLPLKMKKEYQDVISSYMGVEPIEINSALVSAQNRKRLYWTNIPFDTPEDKGIVLNDILENGLADRDKSYCIDAHYYKGGSLKNYLEKKRRQLVLRQSENRQKDTLVTTVRLGEIGKGGQGQRIYDPTGKSDALSAHGGGQGAKTGLYWTEENVRKLTPIECERLQTVPDNYTEGVSNTQRYKMLGNGWTVDVIAHILEGIK